VTAFTVKQRNKPEIHVQLLVTVKKRQPGIGGDEVKCEFVESTQHHHILA
jgi:hypothetical protein